MRISKLSFIPLLASLSCTPDQPATRDNPTPPALNQSPITLQLQAADPQLQNLPFRVLLDFEKDYDRSFLASPYSIIFNPRLHHTGNRCAQLQAQSFSVRLANAAPTDFPGNWTLAGAYFYCKSPTTISISIRQQNRDLSPPRPVSVPANQWVPVWVDLSTLSKSQIDNAELYFQASSIVAPVLCDDILLLNNYKVADAPKSDAQGWTIVQQGFSIAIARPGMFQLLIKTPQAAADGWTLVDANAFRAQLLSTTGKLWFIYSDGRQYLQSQFKSLAPPSKLAAMFKDQHDSPAEIIVPEEFGRVDRNTPGDRLNDGYNESNGAYHLIAHGNRFQARINPKTPVLARPVFEIAGLNPGEASILVEGQLVEKSCRTAKGNLLFELPIAIEKSTNFTVNIR